MIVFHLFSPLMSIPVLKAGRHPAVPPSTGTHALPVRPFTLTSTRWQFSAFPRLYAYCSDFFSAFSIFMFSTISAMSLAYSEIRLMFSVILLTL